MAVNIQQPRNLPQLNGFQHNVYVFQAYQRDAQNQNVLTFQLKAFRTIDERQFQMRHFYEPRAMCQFYYNFTRLLFMGEYHAHHITGTQASVREAQYFRRELRLGFHVYVSAAGNLMQILCAAKRNNGTRFTAFQHVLNDVFPRFKQYAVNVENTPTHRVFVAMKVQIINTAKGDRDGGRCGYAAIGGVYQWRESSILANGENMYLGILGTFLPYFGVYVCANAKLMFLDPCRICLAKNNREVHQSGAFLVIEGFLCFRFEPYNDNVYTGLGLEALGILPHEMITGKQHPIFFLRGVTGNPSIAWALGPIEERREKEHWILSIPENGQFEAIEEYVDGVQEVLHYQSQTRAPWSQHVIRDPQTIYNRPQSLTDYRAPQQCLQRIAARNHQNVPLITWPNVHNNPPQQPNPIPFTPEPRFEQFIEIVVNLALGTPVRIPRQYRIHAHPEFNDPNCVYSDYYIVNRFWYTRVSHNGNQYLDLDYIPLDRVPDPFKYLPVYRYYGRDIVPRCDYNLYRYARDLQNRNEDEDAYVVEFYWRSPLNNIAQRLENI